jgi:hypothetical protein
MSPAARGRGSPITRPRRTSWPCQTSADKNFSSGALGYRALSAFGDWLHNDVTVTGDGLDMEMIWQCLNALNQKTQEPLEFHPHCATNAA